MRDNHDGYPEIVTAYGREGLYFGAVRLADPLERAQFEFGITEAGYRALRRVFNTRPFDSMPGVPYRYFFTGLHGRGATDAAPCPFQVRIEQGASATNREFAGPMTLVANLVWFYKLASIEEASHLRRLDTDTDSQVT